MKTRRFDELRRLTYALIYTLLILNVLDTATTTYAVLLYNSSKEGNPVAYVLIANFGIGGFLLMRLIGGTFALLLARFLIKKYVHTDRDILPLLILFLFFSGFLVYVVVSNLLQLSLY